MDASVKCSSKSRRSCEALKDTKTTGINMGRVNAFDSVAGHMAVYFLNIWEKTAWVELLGSLLCQMRLHYELFLKFLTGIYGWFLVLTEGRTEVISNWCSPVM